MRQFEMIHPQYEVNAKDLEKLGLVLYKQMNTSFARYCNLLDVHSNTRGNSPKEIETLKKICGKSFAESLIALALAREPGSEMTWKWEKELSKPKLVSFMSVPIIKSHPESELIQAIIRIHGREVIACMWKMTDSRL
jgi:hypothetical protein